MRLFSSDLYRHFGFGFALGAVLIVGANADDWGTLATPAQAAVGQQTVPAPTAEFVIAPEKSTTGL